jgi:hypothetical protein
LLHCTRVQNQVMTLRPLALPPGVAGRVLLSSMPGRFEPWTSFRVART